MLPFLITRTMMASLTLLDLTGANRNIAMCDGNLYGHPDATQCSAQLSVMRSSGSNRHHVFALPSVTRRPQDPSNHRLDVSAYQWRTNRVQLPVVNRATRSTARCILGIFPIQLPDGSVSWDKGFYRYMTMDGGQLLGNCIRSEPHGPGGRILTGSYDRLAVILYEPGSEWDFQVQAAEAQNRPIYVPLGAAGHPAGHPAGANLQNVPLVNPPAASTATTTTTTSKPTVKPEPGAEPGPGVKPIKPIPGRPQAPWDAWASNLRLEGQGSSWE